MAEDVMGWNGPIAFSLIASETNTILGVFRLDTFKPEGFFSVQIKDVVGAGVLKLEYVITDVPNAVAADFINPTGAVDIVTAHTATSGEGSDGNDLYQFPGAGEPIFGKWIAFRLSETGTAAPISGNIYPNVQ